ncbi:MAG TPA: septal ring lytic transglycosylase RlpA family protein [Methylomirabilota bacterium]|nr:septal ring lytic transglycosylase RlpA family protein [Methylomirabilota bacterium]
MSTMIRTGRLTAAVAAASLAGLLLVGPALAQTQEGTASFYSDKFEGKKTASGQAYDKSALTASHKKLPYGTKVQVTNLANGKSVVVTVNDRMAQSNKSVIELSRKAAEELDFTKSGKTKVKLEVQK